MKIHILGGPGSGKTTLARMLAQRFSLPHHDLDQVLWKHGNRLDAYIDEAIALAGQPGWVSEGIYLVWVDPLLHQADHIVLLEVPWQVALWRILTRHFRLTLQRKNPYPSRLLLPFLKDTYRYYRSPADPSSLAAVLAAQSAESAPPQPASLRRRLETAAASLLFSADATRQYLQKYTAKMSVLRNDRDQADLLNRLERISL